MSSTLGGPSFSSAIQFELDSGLQPLKLQGLKPLTRRSFSSGLKSRPPFESRDANYFQIRTAPRRALPCPIRLLQKLSLDRAQQFVGRIAGELVKPPRECKGLDELHNVTVSQCGMKWQVVVGRYIARKWCNSIQMWRIHGQRLGGSRYCDVVSYRNRMGISANHKTNDREYLAVHSSHPASTGRCRLPFPTCNYLVVGALLYALFFQIGCSRITSSFAKSQTLSPAELFQKVSPSVFVVEALDENGKTLVLGSAVAIARDFLITNCHVVENGSSLTVRRGKETWNARLIQAVSTHDLCGLRPKADSQITRAFDEQGRVIFKNEDSPTGRPSGLFLSPVNVRPSSDLATGEHVYAIGAPEGLELTFSEGVISALRESEGVHLIQTSAPTSPGSSGGGLFDVRGNLIGITTFQLKEGQSLNFALPGEWIRTSLNSLTEASRKSSPHRATWNSNPEHG